MPRKWKREEVLEKWPQFRADIIALKAHLSIYGFTVNEKLDMAMQLADVGFERVGELTDDKAPKALKT